MDKVAGSGNDEFFTPPYAVAAILPFVPKGAVVWCPFDTEDSHFVKMLRVKGHKVIATHLSTGQDFFTYAPAEPFTHVISNPPYSLKTEVLERLFRSSKPFAMLVGIVGLFESQRRFDMFKANKFEVLYLNRRVAYFKDYGEQKPSLNPPFSSVYLCRGMLPAQVCFAEIKKG